jgi:16S rRNA (cytosine1402-N4)-methyltransferase
MTHISVLSREVLEGLQINKSDTVVDGTINGGGHSELIAKQLGDQGVLVGIDMDIDALEHARERLAGAKARLLLKQGNFRNLDTFLNEEKITSVDRFLFDLGLSSRQLNSSKRGFSFRSEEPLLMTFNAAPKEGELTALEIVNEWDAENIADILYGYGDERYSRQIAKAIVESRKVSKIETTADLVKIIEGSVPSRYKKGKIHSATRTFQALRTTVNDEIQSTGEGLKKALTFLKNEGRIAVITFHSIEDRLVKRRFRDWESEGWGIRITKKPISPTTQEVKENPRARSAKLRIFQKNEKKK